MDEWDKLEQRYELKGNYKMHDENKIDNISAEDDKIYICF